MPSAGLVNGELRVARNTKDKIHASSLPTSVEIIARDKLWVPVRPPDFKPQDPSGVGLNAEMKPKPKSFPFIVLVKTKYVHNTG
jgi:hypothetical protein